MTSSDRDEYGPGMDSDLDMDMNLDLALDIMDENDEIGKLVKEALFDIASQD